jgi:cholesterol transport system auxiliary component
MIAVAKKYLALTLLMLNLIGVAGCAVNTNVNKFTLNPTCIKFQCCTTATNASILVANTVAQPGYDTSQMVYIDRLYQIKNFSRNSWIAPPQQLLTSLLAQNLRSSCYFRIVVISPFAGITQFRLESRLLKLQQEFLCCPSRVKLVMQVILIDNATNRAIADKTFIATCLAPKENPYGGVIAANRATQQILNQVTNFVIANVSER